MKKSKTTARGRGARSLHAVDMLRERVIVAALAWHKKNREEGYGSTLWPESWKDERALDRACANLAANSRAGAGVPRQNNTQ